MIHDFFMTIYTNSIIVEDSLNLIEDEEKKEEEKYLTTKHNEYVLNIDFECESKDDNIPITIIDEREDK